MMVTLSLVYGHDYERWKLYRALRSSYHIVDFVKFESVKTTSMKYGNIRYLVKYAIPEVKILYTI